MSDCADSALGRALNGDFWFPFAVNFCYHLLHHVMRLFLSCPLGVFLKTHLEELTTFYVFEIRLYGNRCTNNFYGYNK